MKFIHTSDNDATVLHFIEVNEGVVNVIYNNINVVSQRKVVKSLVSSKSQFQPQSIQKRYTLSMSNETIHEQITWWCGAH